MNKLILIAFAVMSMMACKKNETTSFLDEIDGKQFKKTSILTSTDSITSSAVDTIPTVVVSPSDCKKDNVWSFNKTAKTFTLDEGASKCDVADPQIKDQGVITEQNNGNSLKVAGTTTNEIWEIESRSSSSFRVSYFAKNSDNVTVKFRVTFTKI